jgi:hypothetical protein
MIPRTVIHEPDGTGSSLTGVEVAAENIHFPGERPFLPRGAMRLSESKIQYLSDRMAAWLAEREDTELLASRETVAAEIGSVIRQEMRVEEELEEEVERVLGRYRSQIDSQNMDIEVLRQKIKRQLARERGIVL